MTTQLLGRAHRTRTALGRRLGATPLGQWLDRVRPTTTWKVLSSVLYSGIIAVAVVGTAALLLGVKPSNPEVTQVAAIETGDCVTIAGGAATRTGCDGEGFSFAVAEKHPAATACSLPSYARVESDGATLCVVPRLALDNCYQVKPDKVATTEVRQVNCPSALGVASANVIRVTERAVGAPVNCARGTALNYSAPQRVGYCITPAS